MKKKKFKRAVTKKPKTFAEKFKKIDKRYKGKVPADLIFNPEKETKQEEIMIVLLFLFLAFACGYIVGVWLS